MARIKGKNDGPRGRNDHYDIGNRKDVPRRDVVAEIKRGEHPSAHVVKINDREYVRDSSRTIQTPRKTGKISRAEIRTAVRSVSKETKQ